MSPTNRWKHNQHFQLQFFTINLDFIASNQVYTCRKLNLPLLISIYLAFLPLEIQRKLKQTKVYHTLFHFVWKETTDKPLKEAASKTLFFSVDYHWLNLRRWKFFIPCDNWKALLFIKVYRFSEVILTAMVMLSLKPVFWKKTVLYALSPH